MKAKSLMFRVDNVVLRLIQASDIDMYYTAGFENIDKEAIYFTGTTQSFTKEIINNFIERIIEDETRYDFLIFDMKDRLLGEAVINNIEQESRSANFRICIFQQLHFNKGIGTIATSLILDFAFEVLHLHRIELEVYDYNPRARHVYEKVGFIQEGVKRDAAFINNEYHDVIIMSILEEDYLLKKNKLVVNLV